MAASFNSQNIVLAKLKCFTVFSLAYFIHNTETFTKANVNALHDTERQCHMTSGQPISMMKRGQNTSDITASCLRSISEGPNS